VDTVNFYQIPNSILLDFGFDLEKDKFKTKNNAKLTLNLIPITSWWKSVRSKIKKMNSKNFPC